ncbi:MAG: TIGR00730 family Rossman fold protein [Patescibacteria group bacterium]|nr:TIGR00730 family Rossman fold protein [Patescibacteria group bacterium]
MKKKVQFYKYHEPVDFRDTWRIFKIMSEFVEGYQFLSKFKGEVTIFGSARTKPQNKYYKAAVKLGKMLGNNKHTVITGGGPGIMEAANKGAFGTKGESIGLNIELPFEQVLNKFVKKSMGFHYFFTRKVMLTAPSQAFAFFPGGFGTMDEFFEVLDYIDLQKMKKIPVVALGKDYWNPLHDFLKKHSMMSIKALNKEQLDLYKIVDKTEDVYAHVKKTKERLYFSDLSPDQFSTGEAANWRIFRIMAELVEGFEFITDLRNEVTILGSSHLGPDTKYYSQAYDLANRLGKDKYTILTGGGPGIMEAANRGAFDAKTDSIGLLMQYNDKVRKNQYLTKSLSFHFPFTRKLIITAPSLGFVVFPGGYGTLHQTFELLTLMQTGKIGKIPLILFGKDFWQPLAEYLERYFYKKYKTINKEDLDLFQIVDSVDEAVKIIKRVRRKK